MNETTTTVATPTPIKAPKVKKPIKAAKKTPAELSSVKETFNLNDASTKILQAIVSLPGQATLAKIEKKTKLPTRTVGHYVFHLRHHGFIKSQRLQIEEGVSEVIHEALAKGKKAAAK